MELGCGSNLSRDETVKVSWPQSVVRSRPLQCSRMRPEAGVAVQCGVNGDFRFNGVRRGPMFPLFQRIRTDCFRRPGLRSRSSKRPCFVSVRQLHSCRIAAAR